MKVLAGVAAAFIAYVVVMSLALASALSGGTFADQGGFVDGVNAGLDAEQTRNATISLTVADELDAPPLSVLAMVVAALGESDLRAIHNSQGSGYCGVFQAHPSNIACDDTELQARSFLEGGLGFQAGGAISLSKQFPSLTPGSIATMVEASGQPGSFYDDGPTGRPGAQLAQARRIIAVWRSGSRIVSVGGPVLERLVVEAQRMQDLGQPYLWGGGHQAFDHDGPWDCSGAVSWLLHYLGLFKGRAPITSTGFMTEGEPGRGREFTIYANPVHVFIVVEAGAHAGESWGTTNNPISLDVVDPAGGPAWHHHATAGFVARHYPGH